MVLGGHAEDDINKILVRLRSLHCCHGFEFHPFKVEWYNDLVLPMYQIAVHPDTLAVLVLSSPSMFNNAFIPYIREHGITGKMDPLDECVAHYMATIHKHFPKESIQVFHDFDHDSNMRPLVAIQTAGHISGAVYYYQVRDLEENPWKKQKIGGVCLHPTYGGWFGIRAVLVFKDTTCGDLVKIDPIDVLGSQELKRKLLECANFHWQDNTFRDMINVVEHYSQEQIEYFNTPSLEERLKLVERYSKENARIKHSATNS